MEPKSKDEGERKDDVCAAVHVGGRRRAGGGQDAVTDLRSI